MNDCLEKSLSVWDTPLWQPVPGPPGARRYIFMIFYLSVSQGLMRDCSLFTV
jgi:hypothetical protein